MNPLGVSAGIIVGGCVALAAINALCVAVIWAWKLAKIPLYLGVRTRS